MKTGIRREDVRFQCGSVRTESEPCTVRGRTWLCEEATGRQARYVENICLGVGTNEWLCRIKKLVLCALGVRAEYEALKKALADANKKAEAELALREKHEPGLSQLSESSRKL